MTEVQPRTPDDTEPDAAEPGHNHALIIGELVTEPLSKALPSGAEIFSFSLTVRGDGEPATSVPLVWFDPPQRVRRWKQGATIIARGRVRRRFYRAGGATGSRTEVEVCGADVFSARSGPRRLLDQAMQSLADIAVPATSRPPR